jgi:predicted lipoprotein with Yx(FWY)xxD motif
MVGRTFGVAIAAMALAGCGSSDSSAEDDPLAATTTASSAASATAATARGPKLRITDSDYGRIVTSGRARALYLFTADTGRASTCTGDCATAWPPYLVKRKPVAAPGVKAGLIGTTRRSDGRLQATYAGHPVYFYEGDNEPGEVLCQAVNEFGGYWYVLRSNGRPIR